MRHHACDIVIIHVGRGVGVRQNVAGVENVERLIFHRPKIEIGDRNDVELAKVIFPAVHILIPFHAGLERGHRMMGLGKIGLRNPDGEIDTLV